ncbi:transcriptional regulator [Roseovarius sp. M141]|nr:transcriptional regulator [Roseovarius sp. M141]
MDDNLRRVYDDMLDDSVPDRFQDLLRQLREQDSEK